MSFSTKLLLVTFATVGSAIAIVRYQKRRALVTPRETNEDDSPPKSANG
jgi:hypothetical protein